jgi:hypothetical protein
VQRMSSCCNRLSAWLKELYSRTSSKTSMSQMELYEGGFNNMQLVLPNFKSSQ